MNENKKFGILITQRLKINKAEPTLLKSLQGKTPRKNSREEKEYWEMKCQSTRRLSTWC